MENIHLSKLKENHMPILWLQDDSLEVLMELAGLVAPGRELQHYPLGLDEGISFIHIDAIRDDLRRLLLCCEAWHLKGERQPLLLIYGGEQGGAELPERLRRDTVVLTGEGLCREQVRALLREVDPDLPPLYVHQLCTRLTGLSRRAAEQILHSITVNDPDGRIYPPNIAPVLSALCPEGPDLRFPSRRFLFSDWEDLDGLDDEDEDDEDVDDDDLADFTPFERAARWKRWRKRLLSVGGALLGAAALAGAYVLGRRS